MTVLFRENRGFPFEEAVRKDSAVHVSLSSDSPVKQPGKPEGLPLPGHPGSDEAKASEPYRWLLPLVDEELQRRAVTPVSGPARPMTGVIWPMTFPCQHQKLRCFVIEQFHENPAVKPLLMQFGVPHPGAVGRT